MHQIDWESVQFLLPGVDVPHQLQQVMQDTLEVWIVWTAEFHKIGMVAIQRMCIDVTRTPHFAICSGTAIDKNLLRGTYHFPLSIGKLSNCEHVFFQWRDQREATVPVSGRKKVPSRKNI